MPCGVMSNLQFLGRFPTLQAEIERKKWGSKKTRLLNSKKFEHFVRNGQLSDRVREIPGIGSVFDQRLRLHGVLAVEDLYYVFLEGQKDEKRFMDFLYGEVLERDTGFRKNAEIVFLALRLWDEVHGDEIRLAAGY